MSKRVLITGADGFIGKNLYWNLKNAGYEDIDCFTRNSTDEDLDEYTSRCDFVYHLAGVNRPKDESEFMEGNANLTRKLIEKLEAHKRYVPVLLSSSTQAGLDNPYGASKRAAEQEVFVYGKEYDVPVYVYRLPNVFGKWSRPNYNSVVATFCHNIARDLPIQINNADTELHLAYIDDVVEQFIRCMEKNIRLGDGEFVIFPPHRIYDVKLGEIARLIKSFKETRKTIEAPDMKDCFAKKLYSTYLSYLPEDKFSYPLEMHEDNRGSFTEFLRTPDRGQVSVNISHPGITKGQHWHNSKNEKFLVVKGKGLIQFRKMGSDEIIDYHVSGEKLEVVDIPTGYTHNIINEGDEDMVTIMWANEAFDPEHPDTFREEV